MITKMFRKMASNSEEIGKNLRIVLEQIHKATLSRPKSLPQIQPRLVAVTKTKPVQDILTAYQHGQRHFGENYVQELEEKSKNAQILEHCTDIKWHFIGHLQRNKSNKVAIVPQLHMVETVDNQKLAQTLHNHWEKFRRPGKLNIMVQVNTSGEANKSGCDPCDVSRMVTYIRDKCRHLNVVGLMTIGAIGYDPVNGPNPDFLRLVECRQNLCRELNLRVEDVELSMGMSSDYQSAIELGSTNVRVGSTIFGSRNTPQTPGPGPSSQTDNSVTSPSQENNQSDNTCSSSSTSLDAGNQSEGSNQNDAVSLEDSVTNLHISTD